jgi:hypothetical protein
MLKKLLLASILSAAFAFAGPCCKTDGNMSGMACDTNKTAMCKLGKNCPCGDKCQCGENCKCKPKKKAKKHQACESNSSK